MTVISSSGLKMPPITPCRQRSHYVITNGGDQPNAVPSEAQVWYYFREIDYPHIKELFELGNTMAKAATTPNTRTRPRASRPADPDRARGMGVAARAVAKQYSWDVIARRHLDLYKQLTRPTPATTPA